MNNNVSVAKINASIQYLEDQFMAPLDKVAARLIENYTELNKSLNSDAIRGMIAEQQDKLDTIKHNLMTICKKAKGEMEVSSDIISKSQETIDEELSRLN